MPRDNDFLGALFDRPAIVRQYVLSAAIHEATDVVVKATMAPRAGGGRFIAVKPKVGPRGGEGDRAKTKASRKANLRRRKKT